MMTVGFSITYVHIIHIINQQNEGNIHSKKMYQSRNQSKKIVGKPARRETDQAEEHRC